MAKRIHTDISTRSKYYLSRHRSLELVHFCLQYPEWQKVYQAIRDISLQSKQLAFIRAHSKKNPTEEIAVKLAYYGDLINMVEKTRYEAAPDISTYLLKAVTEDLSYDKLNALYDIPIGRRQYYEAYRKFFWLLDKKRG